MKKSILAIILAIIFPLIIVNSVNAYLPDSNSTLNVKSKTKKGPTDRNCPPNSICFHTVDIFAGSKYVYTKRNIYNYSSTFKCVNLPKNFQRRTSSLIDHLSDRTRQDTDSQLYYSVFFYENLNCTGEPLFRLGGKYKLTNPPEHPEEIKYLTRLNWYIPESYYKDYNRSKNARDKITSFMYYIPGWKAAK